MEHRLWKTLKGKNSKEKKRMPQFLMPAKEQVTKRSRDQCVNVHDQANVTSEGLAPQSIRNSIDFTTPVKYAIPKQTKYSEIHRKRKESRVPSVKLETIGGYYLPIHEQNIIYGSTTLSAKTKPKDSKRKDVTRSINKSNKIPSADRKLLSLPKISSLTSQASQRRRSRSFQVKNNAHQLTTHLNLIDGREKSQSFSSPNSNNIQELASKMQGNSLLSNLETRGLSLPKITMDEVLKSWDVHPNTPMRKRSPGKYNPMDFLIRQGMESSAVYNSPGHSYDELKSCRYLRLDKSSDEEITHTTCCPCNSCEHGKGLKESPYMNA